MSLRLNRRMFNAVLSLGFTKFMRRPAFGRGQAKIVIVGGGAGGASVATELKRLSPSLDVTLIEQHNEYTSCFFSNTYIGGLYPIHHLTHHYRGLEALGIHVIHQGVTSINLERRKIHLQDDTMCFYDRLVLSPGIDFIWSSIEGYTEEIAKNIPHAWRGKEQLEVLRNQILTMDDGGVVIISVPKLPYRCPPGPYERACLIANYLSQYKPKSKVLILDANFSITKQRAFMEIFENQYQKYIEVYLSNDIDDFTVNRIDPRTNSVFTKSGLEISASVLNIIPSQKAGRIALECGLGDFDWCPVHLGNFLSKKSDHVYVIGDSARADEMPKSAYSAYSQGLQVAAHLAAEFENGPPPKGKYRNVCWSIVAPNSAIKIGADYAPGSISQGKRVLMPSDTFVSQAGEGPLVRKAVYEEATAWYETLTATLFNKSPMKTKSN